MRGWERRLGQSRSPRSVRWAGEGEEGDDDGGGERAQAGRRIRVL